MNCQNKGNTSFILRHPEYMIIYSIILCNQILPNLYFTRRIKFTPRSLLPLRAKLQDVIWLPTLIGLIFSFSVVTIPVDDDSACDY